MAAREDCLRMVEVTCARLCHDLSGLLGSLTGALELITVDRDEDDEALSVADQAAHELAERLKLLRAAWGPDGGPLSMDAITTLIGGLPNAARIEFETSGVPAHTVFPPPVGRVVLNLLILAAESVPGGGRILLAGTAGDLFLRILGPNAAWPAGLATCLADEAAAIQALQSPRGIQMPLAALMGHALGVRLSLLIGPAAVGVPPPIRIGGA